MTNDHSHTDAGWIEIDVNKLSDQSLYQLITQSDGLALEDQFAIELGMDIPAGPAVDTAPPSTLRIREIADATDEYDTTTSTATRSRPLIAARNEGHPGRRFLERITYATALTVTTKAATAEPIEIKPPTGRSFGNQYQSTAAGSVGAALRSIPRNCTQDVYVQLLLVPDPETRSGPRFGSSDSDRTANREWGSSNTFTVGISILVGAPSTGDETVSSETLEREAMQTAKNYFTPTNSSTRFAYTWRHSTSPAELIHSPQLRPDATRYRWFSQHLGLPPIDSGIQRIVKKFGTTPREIHERRPLIGEFLGTPAKIPIRESGLKWLFGGKSATYPTQPHAQMDD